MSWTDGRSGVHVNGFETFPISLGTMLLNPTEVLALGALGPVAPSPPRSAMQQWAGGASTPPHPPTTSASFAAVGHKLFLNADGSFSNANASHNVVMDGFPASLRIGQIIRWCAVKTIRSDPASPLFAEVVQLELLDRTDSTATMPPPLLPPRFWAHPHDRIIIFRAGGGQKTVWSCHVNTTSSCMAKTASVWSVPGSGPLHPAASRS